MQTTQRATLAAALLVPLALLVALAVGEGATRIAAVVSPRLARQLAEYDLTRVLIVPNGEFGYRQKPNSAYRYRNGTVAHSNAMGFRGPPVEVPKPPGVFRIVLLGGSTTHGWAVDDSATIDAYIRQDLAARYPGRRFDVVNLAFDGYDSYQDLERLRSDGLRMQPDLVIVNSGINDVRNARFPDLQEHDSRTLLWAAEIAHLRKEQLTGAPSLWTRIKHWSLLARLPGMARDRMNTMRQLGSATSERAHPEAAMLFERHLERMADITGRRGIALVLSVPPSSLRSYPPRQRSPGTSFWVVDAGTTQAYRDTLGAQMRRVADSLTQRGRPTPLLRVELPRDRFMDDCHLTAEGNRELAEEFVSVAAAFIKQSSRPLAESHR